MTRTNHRDLPHEGGGGTSTSIVTAPGVTAADLGRCSTEEARALLALDIAARLPALPLGISACDDGEVATCAVPLGRGGEMERELRFAVGRSVRLVEVAADVLREAIVLAYHGDDARLRREIATLERAQPEDAPLTGVTFRPESGDAARFLAVLIEYAVAHGASDLHLIPKREGGYVRLRIDGELRSGEGAICTASVFRQIIARLKVLSRLDISAHAVPQDGAFAIPRDGAVPVPARVSIMPTLHGEKAVVRFLAIGGVRELNSLRLSPPLLDALRNFCDRSDGLALFAGPTGSGKSTTIYGLLRELVGRNLSVVSIEDPIEAEVAGIAQTSLCEAVGLDYATALRSVLRQDPDVIGVGEIRDRSSAEAALHAALTGHLVISTVHARRVFEIPLRLRQLGVEPGSVGQAIRLLVCQRLVPTLCRWCKVIDLEASNRCGASVFREVGCARCDYSGYGERRVVAEFLAPSVGLAARIGAGESITTFDLGGERFRSLEAELGELMRRGEISVRTAAAYGEAW